jgi:hypothetical protein
LDLFDEYFEWETGQPILSSVACFDDDWIALKDPSVVRYDDRWHLFCTLRGKQRSHAIVYQTFRDFSDAHQAKPVVLQNHSGYFCAPQVFYFTPQKKWYLICQAKDPTWEPNYQAACATTNDIGDPYSWSPLQPMAVDPPDQGRDPWLDFWVICDDRTAYLFFTSDNGKMWRSQTTLGHFPRRWSIPALALEDDIYEASHIYRVPANPPYINLIEAQYPDDLRLFKIYGATTLDGQWTPLGRQGNGLYASTDNIQQVAGHWADSISHGELIRDGIDQTMRAAPHAPFLFQGVLLEVRRGKRYGDIPWRLGLLKPVRR